MTDRTEASHRSLAAWRAEQHRLGSCGGEAACGACERDAYRPEPDLFGKWDALFTGAVVIVVILTVIYLGAQIVRAIWKQ